MKYVLHYVGIMNRGGMETFLMNIYRKIDRTQFQFHFIVHGDDEGDFDNEIYQLGGKIIHFPHFRDNPIKYRKVWHHFWQNNSSDYSVFHFHTNSLANIVPVKMSIRNGFYNIIIHSHSSYADKGFQFQKLHNCIHFLNQKYINRYNIEKIAVSNLAGNWLFGKESQFCKIPNGISYDQFNYRPSVRSELRGELNLEKNLIIGHVGNFFPVKNHAFLLVIFKEFRKKYPESKLLLLGDGPLKSQILSKVKELELDDHVVLLGSVSNVAEYLNIFDVFLFPSFYEGLPLATIEAQINLLPLVVSKKVSEEIIISDRISFLDISSSNIEAWCEQIESFILSEIRQKDTKVMDTFNIDNTLNMIISLYTEIANR